jgi:plastocyanin
MSARPLLVALVGLVAGLLGPVPAHARPVAPAPARASASVEVAHLMFMPGKVKVGLGDSVTWTFPEALAHTTTSDQGFWDSGPRSGGATYVRAFGSAGSFAYHCSIHPTMHGKVSVPVRIDVPSEARRRIVWATTAATKGITFDVQVRVGNGPWTDFRVDTTKPRAGFKPVDVSKAYRFRARTTRKGLDSGWSKPVRTAFA